MTKDKGASAKIEETIELATTTLTGDIRDFLLDRVKQLGKPWVAMTEEEQRDQINAAKTAAEHLVKQVVTLIASEGRKAMVGQLVKVQVKDNIQCQLNFAKTDELRHNLFDSAGHAVLLVMADSEPFEGEKGPATPTPNQANLLDSAEKLKGEKDKVTPLR